MLEEGDQSINLHRVALPEAVQTYRSQYIDPEKDVTPRQWSERMNMLRHHIQEVSEQLPLISPAAATRRLELMSSLADLKIISPSRFEALQIPDGILNGVFEQAYGANAMGELKEFLKIAKALMVISPDRLRTLIVEKGLLTKIGARITQSSEGTSEKAEYVILLKHVAPEFLATLPPQSIPDFPAALDIVAATSANTDSNSSESFMDFRLHKIANYRLAASRDIKQELAKPFVERTRAIIATQVAIKLETLKHAMIATADKVEIGEHGLTIINNTQQPEKNTDAMPVLKMR